MAASPICTVQDGSGSAQATTNGVNVTPGATVTIQLASIAGADIWTIEPIYTDELGSAPALTINSTTKTATFTAPVAGRAVIFRSTVQTLGDSNTYSATFGVYTLTGSGNRVVAFNETLESNANFGWASTLNPMLRGSTGIVPSWRSVYSIDFSAQTTQTFSADGNYTIGSQTWTVANKANATTMGITAGQGLVITPNTTNSAYSSGARTMPLVSIPVTSLLSSYDSEAVDLRLWVYIAATNADQNTELVTAAFERASAPTVFNCTLSRGFSTAQVLSMASTLNTGTTLAGDISGLGSSDNVMVFTFAPRRMMIGCRYGTWASGFPTSTTIGRKTVFSTNSLYADVNGASDMRLVLGAQTGNTSGNFSATIGAIRLEALF